MSCIHISITEEGLFSKWVGAELVNAIDSKNPHIISYLLRNRKTLTSTIMLGKEGDTELSIYVEALGEEGRCPVAFFTMSKELYDFDGPETEKDTFHQLATLIEEHSFDVSLEGEEDIEDDDLDTDLKVEDTTPDKSVN